MKKKFSLRKRAGSIGYAAKGLRAFFKEEHNAWIHLVATLAIGIAGYYFGVSTTECIALVIVIGFVWVAEAFNTVIERAMDLISPQKDSRVAFIKDLSAGAVLLASIVALITGCIVFIPKIF